MVKHSEDTPTIALESTVISHALPHLHSLRLEEIVHEGGATPATVGIIAGEIIVGLSRDADRAPGDRAWASE